MRFYCESEKKNEIQVENENNDDSIERMRKRIEITFLLFVEFIVVMKIKWKIRFIKYCVEIEYIFCSLIAYYLQTITTKV